MEELGLAVLAAALPLPSIFHPPDLVLPESGSPLARIQVQDVLGLETPPGLLASRRMMVQALGSLPCSMKATYLSLVFRTSEGPALT